VKGDIALPAGALGARPALGHLVLGGTGQLPPLSLQLVGEQIVRLEGTQAAVEIAVEDLPVLLGRLPALGVACGGALMGLARAFCPASEGLQPLEQRGAWLPRS